MIYYHSELNKPLNLWGISVPLHDKRASNLFIYLHSKYSKDLFLNPGLKSYTFKELEYVHSRSYCQKLQQSPHLAIEKCYEGYLKNIKNDEAQNLVDRSLQQAWGTYEAISLSLTHSFVYYLGGGMHHAMRDDGRGFCLINDIALAIKKMQKEGTYQNIWIIDVDAHKGDGNAEIFYNDPVVKTLSIHMEKGWPLDGSEDERSFIPSYIDIPISLGEEERYLSKLEEGLNNLAQTGHADFAIVVHGMDVWKSDELKSSEGIKLSDKQIRERDQMIFNFLKEKDIPQTYVMAGGYGELSWKLYAQFLDWVLQK